MKSVYKCPLQNSYVCQSAVQQGDVWEALLIPSTWFGSCMTPWTAMGFQSWEASLRECKAQHAGGLLWMQLQLSECLAGQLNLQFLGSVISKLKIK